MGRERVEAALSELEREGLRRSLRVIERVEGPFVWIEGRRFRCFCSNDYLGLSQHPDLSSAFEGDGPAGSGASRLLSGTTSIHRKLEEAVAQFKGLPDALLFNSAYVANVGLLTSIARSDSVVVSDALNHASLIDGARLSKAKVRVFPHRDAGAVEEILRETGGHRILVTESLFSMDGDRAPLGSYRDLSKRYGADLVVDDTHAFGLFGKGARGLADRRCPIQVCNLSKAGGLLGGFVLGEESLIELLVSRARTFIYTTAFPPPLCRAALRALRLIEAADDRRGKLEAACRRLKSGLERLGIEVIVSGPIFPVVLGDTDRAVRAAGALWERGFFLPAIRPPTVPEGKSRLRISLTALHREEDVDALLDALEQVL